MANIIDPVEDPTGLLPVATSDPLIKVSEDDTVGREPTSKTVRLENEANTVTNDIPFVPDSAELFADSVAKSFTSGGNFAYELYKRAEREALSPPPDPSFDSEAFIQRNRKVIPQALESQFRLATSDKEANLILSDMRDEINKQEILARRGGFSTFVASGLAGIVDLDTPLAVLSGGASAGFKGGIMATKWGRLMSTAASGAATQASLQTLAFEAGTTGDWTSIPAAGLGGMVFGAAGGALRHNKSEDGANAAVAKAAQEFDEYVADGAPLATDKRGPVVTHDNPYSSDFVDDPVQLVIPEGADGSTFKLSDIQTGPTDLPLGNVSARHIEQMDDSAFGNISAVAADTNFGDTHARLMLTPDEISAAKAHGVQIEDNGVLKNEELQRILDERDRRISIPAGSTMKEVQGESGGSIGARQMQSQGSVATIQSPRIQKMISDARNFLSRSGVEQEYNDGYTGLRNRGAAGDLIAKAATRFHDFLAASPLATDYDRMWRSGSAVARRVAYDVLESASGIVRNNTSAAAIMEVYKNRLGEVSMHLGDARALWDKENGLGRVEAYTSSDAKRAFNRAVQEEMQARAYDPPGTPRSVPLSVKQAADALDEWGKLDIEIGKGRPGETPVKGYENLDHYSGYIPQKWSGAAMEDMLRTKGRTLKDLTEAIGEIYTRMHGFPKADAEKYAAAVINRARRSEQGLDVNLIGILQQDGSEFLADTLKANGISDRAANALIDKLKGEAAERGQAGHTKGRIDVDMRMTASNGIKMLDLMDNDIAGIIERRVRSTAGAAALARKGIASRTDIAAIKEAILSEQQARGRSVPTGVSALDKLNDLVDRDKHLTAEHIDALFTPFTGGALSGGVNPYVGAAMKLTNLAFLPQLGLTQMSELGAQMSSVGLKRWFEHAGYALRGKATDPRSELAKELRHMGVMVPEDKYFRNDLNLDMDRQGPASSWFMQKMQTALNMGQRIQGYTSAYYQVRNFQQRVAVTSAADKIMRNMKGLANDLSTARAEDIGLNASLYARVKAYVDNGTVTFKDGSLYKTNFDQWHPDDAFEFSVALNRHVNQVVQKSMAGESSVLFHKDGVSSLFFHLKSFSLLAVEKQLLRNVKHQDSETLATFFAGLATAAAAYSVKQGINGNTQNLTLDKIARGAVGYSNMTGWLPMWSDPVASILGFDKYRINNYGSRGQAADVLSIPAAASAVNSILHIPAVPKHVLNGEFTNNDVRALQTTPIIGRAYGMTYLLNQLKTKN